MSLFRNFVCSPPPSYQEVYAAERDQPPTYEDVVKLDADKQNVQTQGSAEIIERYMFWTPPQMTLLANHSIKKVTFLLPVPVEQ